jgi:ribosomal protein S18 acetylase RimI-like enzyme
MPVWCIHSGTTCGDVTMATKTATRVDAPEAGDVLARPLTASETDAAADLLARGFAEEPGNLALLPDPSARFAMMRIAMKEAVRAALPYGTVQVATVGDDLGAIAVWHPPGVSATPVGGVARVVAGKLTEASALARSLPNVASVMLRHAPQAFPLVRARRRAVRYASRGTTWHLAFLATAPEHRGRGLARALLERQLERCDEDGQAAWLETTDPVNPPIYERFGFGTVAHLDDAAWLPGLWVMRRDPEGSTAGQGTAARR